MSSLPQFKPGESTASKLPFASYAQVVRMLMPPAQRIGFYDARGRALWVSDGIEEPEFRMHLDLVLARFASRGTEELRSVYGATEQAEPIYVFPIRDSSDRLLGAIGLLCRELPSTAAYRRVEHVERLLTPLIEILSQAWRAQAERTPAPARDTKVSTLVPAEAKTDMATPLPALLRRTLALATRSLDCAFGAVIAVERPFMLNHRVSPEESDLAINAAIENVKAHVIKWMRVRNEPLIFNGTNSGHSQSLPFKLLALPLRAAPGRLAAVMVLFKEKQAADFGTPDLAALAQIASQIPASALSELIPPATAPSAPTVREPRANQPTAQAQPASSSPAAVPPRDTRSSQATRVAPVPEKAAAQPAQPRRIAAPAVVRPPAPPAPPRVVQISAARSHMTMEERIRAALRDDGFDLYVQKIAPLRDDQRAERYEVLLRMSEGDTLYTPQMFFAAAEANELMPDLDQWVIRELMGTLRKRAAALRANCWEFSINIAAQTLLTDRFSEYVIEALNSSSIPAGLLVFEIAESDAIEHQYSLSILAQRLHSVGCRIALDNCRAGLRTFDTVRKWPVSCVKIDGSLIRHVVSNCRYESQVRAVARLANSMGIETVAECVENESTCDKLLTMDIDYAQGFHLGKPQPLSQLFC